MTPQQAASIRRILREGAGAHAPKWMTPDWVVANMPVDGDIIMRSARRIDRIMVLCAVARTALREIAAACEVSDASDTVGA